MIPRKTTKELLGESLHELSESRPLDKITIREIVENCGMSPATFYRHFHDKLDLMAWMYNYQMEDLFLDFCEGSEDWRQTLFDMLKIIENDWSFYRSALKDTDGPNSFFNATHKRCGELLTAYVSQSDLGADREEILFDVWFYLRGISLSVREWCVRNQPRDTETLVDCLYRAMPEKLKPILMRDEPYQKEAGK
ncbi:MAG: TetR family transcriptional regulator [Lachnospiraceae bacterium]|nr:TetR family transcriptional regulator [Lachnospiraceae bacterium]